MNEEEEKILNMLGEAFVYFRKLGVLHPSDLDEFALHVHGAQNIVLARAGLRGMYNAGKSRPLRPLGSK